MNILLLSTFFPPSSFGGDGIFLKQLAEALADQGHGVDVVHCADSYRALAGRRASGPPPSHPGVRVHALESRFGALSPIVTQQTGRAFFKRARIRSLLKERRFDVLHFHNISLLGADALSIAPPDYPAITVLTTHEHWLICPMHVLWKFNSRVCEGPDCIRCTIRGGRPPQLWRYTSLLSGSARRVDQFISPSRFTAAMHAERGFSPPFEILPNFVPKRAAPPAVRAERNGQSRPYFLFVGRLEPIKGLQTVIARWERIPWADLVVAGEGSHAASLRAMAAGRPGIRFIGWKPAEELEAWFDGALATIIPSLCPEVFPLVCIESMSRRTPVVARRVGALTEVVDESGGGVLYESDDELPRALNELQSPDRRSALAQAAYSSYLQKWTADVHLAAYERILARTSLRKFGRVLWES